MVRGGVTPRLGEVSRSCALYFRDHHGSGHGARIWTKQVALGFLPSELAVSGATRIYRYRGYAHGADLVVYADCRIPATAAAARRADRVFGVQRARFDDSRVLVTDGCVNVAEDGTCELAPITGTACQSGGDFPDCSSLPGDFETCGMLGTCGGRGWPVWPGGGGGWTPSEGDGTDRPPCTRGADGFCIARLARTTIQPGETKSEWQRLGEKIAAIKENIPECLGAKQALMALYSQGAASGRIRFWDGYDITVRPDGTKQQRYGQNLSDQYGRYIEYDSHWAFESSVAVVHEGLHLYLHLMNSPLTGNANEEWVKQMAAACV
jgi:hypothetical protein